MLLSSRYFYIKMEIANLSISDNENKNTIQYFYTGTSCMNTNSPNSNAAICICFNGDVNDTMIELLDESLSTNQKAELHAIYRALLCIIDESDIHIISKSDYAVKCVNVWSNQWRQNNWKNISYNTTDNKSIVRSIVELKDKLTDEGKNIIIYHWNNASSKEGNNIAHNLARDAILNNL